jgi:glycosyltransferase involved in cell wall biosynthesis
MKKILIITTQYVPEAVGRASRMQELAKALKNFYKIQIIAPPPTWPYSKFPKVNYLSHHEQIDEIDILRIWTYQPKNENPSAIAKLAYHLIFPINVCFSFISSLRNVSTVIISAQPPPILLSALFVIFARKKLILDIGDLDYGEGIDKKGIHVSILKKISKKIQLYCWKKSDFIITNTLGIQTRIQKILEHNNPNKVKYFPFNVDTALFRKHENVRVEKQIVYTGMFGALQNLPPLIKAIRFVVKEIPDLMLHLYGGGKYQSELQNIIRELDLEDNCIIHDPVSRNELPLILSKSLIGIVPLSMDKTLSFANPSKTFEYMACSLPVFGYGASDAIKEILNKTNSGVYLKTDDPLEIAKGILEMLNDQKTLKGFGKNGQKFVESRANINKKNSCKYSIL